MVLKVSFIVYTPSPDDSGKNIEQIKAGIKDTINSALDANCVTGNITIKEGV